MPIAARVAKNESLFRDVNERISELHGDLGGDELMRLVCECSDISCAESIEASVTAYRNVRQEPTHFVVAPGHVDIVYERVVSSHTRFMVVEKFGLAGRVAEALDQ